MSGNRVGGLKTAKINKEKYGDNFYERIGRTGGSVKNTKTPKGFAANRELARTAGAKGGRNSRRGKVLV